MQELLDLLSDGCFHSGAKMGERLGISRAAVWKKIRTLEMMGLPLDCVRGKGYRLGCGMELLNRDVILGMVANRIHPDIELYVCLSTGSTNDLVRELGAVSPGITRYCLAEHQDDGRGRRGRKWHSPLGATISFSALWQQSEGMASLEGLSLAVGLAVVKALETLGAKRLKLKWPNDILCDGKKLCGVLLEVVGDPTGECQVVVGIGINVRLGEKSFAAIGQPATDLHCVCGQFVSRNAVVSAVINAFSELRQRFGRYGFAYFQESWCEYDAFRNRPVQLVASDRIEHGRCLGVNKQGGLLLETEMGVTVFHGGEVSLRKL